MRHEKSLGDIVGGFPGGRTRPRVAASADRAPRAR